MNCIFQRIWHSSVRFEDKLLVESTYCGTDREACARMYVDPESFAVLEAWWESYRSPQEKNYRITDITDKLAGMEAYLGCGPTLRESLTPMEDSYAYNLFAECVRGMVQSETFLYDKRGFSSPEEYDKYWEKMYLNSCRYYSNLDRVRTTWFDHVGYSKREGALYNKMKTQGVYTKDDEYFIMGQLIDSFHSVAVELNVDKKNYKVKEAQGEILRAPDDVCAESNRYIQELIGENLQSFRKKEIAEILGAGNGCVHFIDLVSDASETLELLQEG